MGEPEAPGLTYAASGVDIAAGDEVVERIRRLGKGRQGVLGGIGGFAGLFSLSEAGRWSDPVLVASTDGVGTKSAVAAATGRYGSIGVDLVAMCVDDLACAGGEPLFLLDYIAMGRLDPRIVEEVVTGIAGACQAVGAALLGGETAEHPGAMAPGELDLAGFAVGVAEREQLLGSHRVRPGDVLVGLGSPGLRSNGYSLARAALLERAGRDLEAEAWPGAGVSLADELLLPSVLYSPLLRGLAASAELHAASHVTGGGIAANLARSLPPDCDAVVEIGSWAVPRIFEEIRLAGGVADDEMAKTFNMGLGMILVAEADSVDSVLSASAAAGLDASVVGEVRKGSGNARLEGSWRQHREDSSQT